MSGSAAGFAGAAPAGLSLTGDLAAGASGRRNGRARGFFPSADPGAPPRHASNGLPAVLRFAPALGGAAPPAAAAGIAGKAARGAAANTGNERTYDASFDDALRARPRLFADRPRHPRAALYGHRPHRTSPIPRPLPDEQCRAGALIDIFETFAAMLDRHPPRTRPRRPALVPVNLFHRAADRVHATSTTTSRRSAAARASRTAPR